MIESSSRVGRRRERNHYQPQGASLDGFDYLFALKELQWKRKCWCGKSALMHPTSCESVEWQYGFLRHKQPFLILARLCLLQPRHHIYCPGSNVNTNRLEPINENIVVVFIYLRHGKLVAIPQVQTISSHHSSWSPIKCIGFQKL